MCGLKSFPVHRMILALKSPVLKSLLERNGGVKRLVILDLASDILEAVIENIYTGEVPANIKHNAPELLYAAEKYGIAGLAKVCEESFMGELTPENATTNLFHINRFQARQRVLDYIKENIEGVVKSENWKPFMREHPDLVTDIVLNNAKVEMKPPAKKAKLDMPET